MMYILTLFFIYTAFALTTTTTVGVQPKTAKEEEDYCNLNCLLKSLDLNLELGEAAVFEVDLKISKLKLALSKIRIWNFDLQDIKTIILYDEDEPERPNGFDLTLVLGSANMFVSLANGDSGEEIADATVGLRDAEVGLKLVLDGYEYKGYPLINNTHPGMKLNIDSNKMDIDIKLKGGLSFLNSFVGMIANMLKSTLLGVLQDYMGEIDSLIKVELDKLFWQVNANYTEKYIDGVVPVNVPAGKGLMNLTESSLFDAVSWLTTSLLGGNSSLSLNQLINTFTRGSGSLVFGEYLKTAAKDGKEIDLDKEIDKFFEGLSDLIMDALNFRNIEVPSINATLNISLSYLEINGLNTWNRLSILDPVRHNTEYNSNVSMCDIDRDCDYQLKISSGLEHFSFNIKFEINASADGEILNTQGKKMFETGQIEVSTNSNYLEGRIQLGIIDDQFELYSQNMMTNMTCWLSLLDTSSTGIPMLLVESNITKIDFAAASARPEQLEQGVNDLINGIANIFIYNYKPVIPYFLNGLLNEFVVPMVNDLFADMDQSTCDDDPDPMVLEYVPSAVASTISISAVLGILLFIIALLILILKRRKNKSEDVYKYDINSEESERSFSEESIDAETIKKMSVKEKAKYYSAKAGKSVKNSIDPHHFKKVCCSPKWLFKQFMRTDPEGASMFLDSRIPIIVRVIVPVIILLNVAVFIISNSGTGATVNAYIHFADANTMTLNISDFGLMNSVTDMWTAGAYPLSILIMVFSGIWPYAKLIMLLMVWMIPTKVVSKKGRGRILHFLDAFGKWSFLDSYVMTLMIVAFFFDIPIPFAHPTIIEIPFGIKLYVDAALGFVLLMMGTLISLLLSHILIFIHNALLSDKSDNHGSKGIEWKPLCMYSSNWFIRIFILAGIIISAALVIVGLFIQSFAFDFFGLAGWALGILGHETHRDFSLMDLGIDLPGASRVPDGFNTIFIQVIYFVTVVVMPIVHHIVLILYWVVPMNRRLQYIAQQVCDTLYAWACMDVFIISVIAAVLELSQFAGFMVEDMCGAPIEPLGNLSLDGIIGLFFGKENLIQDHETCFEVAASLKGGCWCLFISAIIYTIVHWTVSVLGNKALNKRLPTEEEKEEYWRNRENEETVEMESLEVDDLEKSESIETIKGSSSTSSASEENEQNEEIEVEEENKSEEKEVEEISEIEDIEDVPVEEEQVEKETNQEKKSSSSSSPSSSSSSSNE